MTRHPLAIRGMELRDRLQHALDAARLQHPHILPRLDSGQAEGFLYYVMPYVDGQSLRDRPAP